MAAPKGLAGHKGATALKYALDDCKACPLHNSPHLLRCAPEWLLRDQTGCRGKRSPGLGKAQLLHCTPCSKPSPTPQQRPAAFEDRVRRETMIQKQEWAFSSSLS